MKFIAPLLFLFLSACVHHHRHDAHEDVYYQDDYYAYDGYDPYYGYGNQSYSSAGGGVYYNNYNYYPDRWGINYSTAYYSPYRYPRLGFYYASSNCGHWYWSSWCSPNFYGHYYGHRSYRYGWPHWGFSIGFSSYYDNYWWYNHWRNRTYDYYRPSRSGYHAARNEVRRLSRDHATQYRSHNRNDRYRNQAGTVYRGRDTGHRSYRNQSVPVYGSGRGVVSSNRSQGTRSNRGASSARSEVLRQQTRPVPNSPSQNRTINQPRTTTPRSSHSRYQSTRNHREPVVTGLPNRNRSTVNQRSTQRSVVQPSVNQRPVYQRNHSAPPQTRGATAPNRNYSTPSRSQSRPATQPSSRSSNHSSNRSSSSRSSSHRSSTSQRSSSPSHSPSRASSRSAVRSAVKDRR